MVTIEIPHVPRIRDLPASMPVDGAVNIVLVEGIPIFRASSFVQERIEHLLEKLHIEGLTDGETEEIDLYQDVDDYLSYLNRIARNITLAVDPL